MKRTFIVAVLIFSGCSTDSAKPLSKPSKSKPYPGIMTKPSADNRRAIMSNDRPDWEADERHEVRIIGW